jgi:very-short-patch-repair endonuclease
MARLTSVPVIRFRNQALDEDIWGVVEEIRRVLATHPSPALTAK